MAQGYYTLEEAAQVLGMSVDELKQIARKGEVRSFQDRGTWRFRVQDIQELVRRRSPGSEPELTLGESLHPRPIDTGGPKTPKVAGGPKSNPPSPTPKSKPPEGGDVFDFTLDVDDDVAEIGKEPRRSKLGSSPKSPSPTATPGSDSDVRLVPDDDAMDFQIEVDSDVKMVDTPKPGAKPASKLGGPPSSKQKQSKLAGPASSPRPSKLGGPPSSKQKQSKLANPPTGPRPSKLEPPRKTGMGSSAPLDSGVRLVPADSDSDVRIIPPDDSNEVALGQQPPPSSTDSDIRLEMDGPAAAEEGLLTEEINLDEELRKQEAAQKPAQSKIRPAPGSNPQLPTTSPFELNESQLRLPESSVQPRPAKDDSSDDFELMPAGESSSPLEPGSSDLELTPSDESSSPLEPGSGDFDLSPVGESGSPVEGGASDEFTLELPEDSTEANLMGTPAADDLKGPSSGIVLDKPLDSGISLEQGGEGSDEIEFTLNLDDEATPKPAPAAAEDKPNDSSSDFELSLDADSPGGEQQLTSDSSSEFELSLELDEEPKQAPAGDEEDPSSSEFELTLDSGEQPAPAAAEDSDSEFELTLDSGEEPSPAAAAEDSDSEFELTLDSGEQPAPGEEEGSSSEFELTLDDSGNLSALEEAAVSEGEEEEKDIFETDFEVPALEEESGSEAVALEESDTDLESSDFDLALGDEDVAGDDEESGSQVVALDEEEEADDAAATVAHKKRTGRVAPELDEDETTGFDDIAEQLGEAAAESEEEEEEEEELVGAGAAVSPPWGAMPVVFMLPCVVVMFLVGVMGFELVQSMTSYKPPGMLTKALTDLVKK